MRVTGQDVARQLWQLWQQGQQPDLAEFLAGIEPLAPLDLAGVLRIDQCQRWQIQQRVAAEHYLQAYPAVARDEEAALDVIYAEFRLRQDQGEAVSPEEFFQRFPAFTDQLQLQLGLCMALATNPLSTVPPPEKTVPLDQVQSASSEEPVIPGYQVLGTLGRGGMGIVYLAQQFNPPRLVALKMILGGVQPSPEELARFRAEAEAIARLNHPNIVQIYEVGEHEGRPFFSLEFVEGVTLAKAAHGLQRPHEAATLVETLARAMHHAHQRGLVHRDLTPANILFRKDGVPKITDFGLARFLDNAARLTQTGDFLGTPAYTSPEQASGLAYAAGPPSDVYGLGGILYYLLTTRPPFPGTSVLQTLERVRNEDPARPGLFHRGCPRDLETICLKCLRKEPHKRYVSTEELAEDLSLFRQGKPIKARPTPPWERLLKWCQRRPTAASLAGVVVLLVLLATIGLTVAQVRQRLRLRVLRDDAETSLRLSREGAERKQWSETEVHLDNVQKGTGNESSLADLNARAGQLRTAYARFRQFLQQRDDALFQGVYSALFPGQGSTIPLFPEAMEEELASVLSEGQRAEMVVSRYEMLLVQADLAARAGDTIDPVVRQRQGRRALEILDQAAPLRGETHAYHLRRAYYFGLIDAEPERQKEKNRAEALAPASVLDHFLSGIHFYQQGELNQAVHSFETALRLQPDHFWSQFFLAASQLRARTWLAAEYALNSCQMQRSGFPWTLLLRGFAQVELAKFTTAEDDFRQAELALQCHSPAADALPDNKALAALSVYRGILCFRQGQLPRAAVHFRKAIEYQPALYQAHASLLRVLVENYQLDEANKRIPELIALNPPAVVVADYHTQRARHLLRIGKNHEAEAACNAALAIRKDHAEAFAIRGQVLLQLLDYPNAADSFDRYLECRGQPLADVYRGRGQARMKLGRFGEAGDDYTRALDLTVVPVGLLTAVGLPGLVCLRQQEAELLLHRGWARFFDNAFEGALGDFDRARQGLPRNADSCAGSGLCKVMLGRYREAVKDGYDALRLKPATPEMMFNVACLFSLAVGKARADATQTERLEREREYLREAIAAIRSALNMVPSEQRAQYWEKQMRSDPALDPIRARPEFSQLEKDYSPRRPN